MSFLQGLNILEVYMKESSKGLSTLLGTAKTQQLYLQTVSSFGSVVEEWRGGRRDCFSPVCSPPTPADLPGLGMGRETEG